MRIDKEARPILRMAQQIISVDHTFEANAALFLQELEKVLSSLINWNARIFEDTAPFSNLLCRVLVRCHSEATIRWEIRKLDKRNDARDTQ